MHMVDVTQITCAEREERGTDYWRTHHPSNVLPPEHTLGELLHQCAILEAQSSGAKLAQGTAAVTGSDRDFLGSAMTAEHHATSLADIDEQDEMNRIFLEAYAHMYHQQPRYKYAGEKLFPSESALQQARSEFEQRLESAHRAHHPHPFETAPRPPAAPQQAVVRTFPEKEKDHIRAMSLSWAGTEHAVVLCKGGHVLVVDANSRVRRAGVFPQGMLGHASWLVAAGLSLTPTMPPTLLAAGGLDNLVSVWDGRTADAPAEDLPAPEAPTADRPIRIEKGPPCCVLSGHVGYISALRFVGGCGGSRLLSGSGDGTAMLWDVSAGVCVLGMLGHRADITQARLASAETNLACTSSIDGTTRVWDLRSGACVRLFETSQRGGGGGGGASGGHTHVDDCDITADGRLLASLGHDGRVSVHDVGGYATVVTSDCACSELGQARLAFADSGRTLLISSRLGTAYGVDSFDHDRTVISFPEVSGGPASKAKGAGSDEPANTVTAMELPSDASERVGVAWTDGKVQLMSWGSRRHDSRRNSRQEEGPRGRRRSSGGDGERDGCAIA